MKVLCVDDDPDCLELLSRVLKRHGAKVTTQPSAELAIECLAGNVFDVLISDIMMPPATTLPMRSESWSRTTRVA